MQENDLLQQLPKELLRTLHGCRFTKDTLGCSSAVVLHVPERRSYLKIAPYNPVEPLLVEAAVLEWLQDRLPVPKVPMRGVAGQGVPLISSSRAPSARTRCTD